MNKQILDKILPFVESPARYTGNELNSISKKIQSNTIRYAFAFPDIYEVGMSHLGMKILYHLLNEQKDVFCERVFAPWIDMELQMRENNIKLFSLETKDEISKFDFIGFTLQYEMSYTNMLNMLDLAQIPLMSKDRNEEHPIIMAGGPCTYNPEPIAQFVDIVVVGEAEESILDILDLYKEYKNKSISRDKFLFMASQIQGIYVPEFYKVDYNDDKTIKNFSTTNEHIPIKIKKRFINDIDKIYFPKEIIVPFIQAVHDRIMLEVFRGCTRGCRFCQAGMLYRPVREKSIERLKEDAKALIDATGYEEISLSSLSTSDYTYLQEIVDHLIDEYKDKKVAVGLPSQRIDTFSIDLAEKLQKVRKTGLTFAPEAGTQRLRNVINKGVTESNLMDTTAKAFELGWGHIKLYFMIGLPTECQEDIEGIPILAEKVIDQYYQISREKRNKKINIVISSSSFVPKAFTPFQWEPQDSIDQLIEKQRYLKNSIKNRKIQYKWHDPKLSKIESVFARGDRKLGDVLLNAFNKGCKFDGWGDHFDYNKWMEAFKECNIDPDFYSERKRDYDEILPWDFIDIGVTKDFLIRESKKAYEEEITQFCREKCHDCGITELCKGWVCNDFS